MTHTGERAATLGSTCHDKLGITVILSAAADGTQKRAYMIFQGKGVAKDD